MNERALRNGHHAIRHEELTSRQEALRYILEERRRLARDLHDGVVQDLAYANMQLKALCSDTTLDERALRKEVARITEVLDQCYDALRHAMYDLTFHADADLVAFVARYLKEFQARTGIAVAFHHEGVPAQTDPYVNNQLAKVLQEALANVRKHADARNVRVALTYQGTTRQLRLVVADDGKGFVPPEATADNAVENHPDRRENARCTAPFGEEPHRHFGMRTMRERCQLLGGTLQVTSAPGAGTEVTVDIPL
ncbi:hypothetical protein GCM10010885_22000 [Alicyclobacillus cellulosilyticus]|uniref:histidine kinase n=1 Tax=Alicyclobacillus cellulosilyticus TaxID=1003997 RepID=A0A917KI43_9BACL|nr:sensor histidine kinase [Alicyclobacillus cellulosilyticus]GGJ12226.1 hypothetical protein GCM10010885_22000 [Alicyclobacillus cellulosilyticus]